MRESTANTVKNAAIGAAVTFLISFIPFLGFLSALFGGGASGYLQNRGSSGGAWVGVVMALLSGIPALLLALYGAVIGFVLLFSNTVLGSLIAFIGFSGGIGGMFIIFLWSLWMIYALILGLLGGIIGGTVASYVT